MLVKTILLPLTLSGIARPFTFTYRGTSDLCAINSFMWYIISLVAAPSTLALAEHNERRGQVPLAVKKNLSIGVVYGILCRRLHSYRG